MTNQPTQQNKKLHTAITAGFLGLVVLVGVSVLYGGSYSGPTQQVEAESIEQNETTEFTIDLNTIDPNINSFSVPSTAYVGENFTIGWDVNNYEAGNIELEGPNGTNSNLSPDDSRIDSISSTGNYTYTLRTDNVEDTQTDSASRSVSIECRNPAIDSFSRTSGGGTVYEDESFRLSWDTSNADNVYGSGDWSPSNLSSDGNRSVSESGSGSYTYTLNAENTKADCNKSTSDSVTVDVEQRPESYDLSLDHSGVDIDGVPGSEADQGINIDGENGFSGDVDLSVEDVPDSLKDENGNNKVDFTFEDSTIDGDGNTDLNMEVIQAIDESTSPLITVRAEAPSGSVDDGNHNQEETFRLNVDAFSPRTIEEF